MRTLVIWVTVIALLLVVLAVIALALAGTGEDDTPGAFRPQQPPLAAQAIL